MYVRQAIVFLLSAATCVAVQAAVDIETADTASVVAMATKVLEARLQSVHPHVLRFEVTPLSHQDAMLSPMAIESLSVIHVGARSAVRALGTVLGRIEERPQVDMIWFDVKGIQPVVVATRQVSPLTALSETDGVVAERDVMNRSCEPLSSVESLMAMRAKRGIREGDVYCAEYLEPRPAVTRGDAVTVHFIGEQIELTTKGIARHDAMVGQRLTILNPATRETFSGVVAAMGEVQVHAR
jgi:flagellar basal body P-ring formation protein FlgA